MTFNVIKIDQLNKILELIKNVTNRITVTLIKTFLGITSYFRLPKN